MTTLAMTASRLYNETMHKDYLISVLGFLEIVQHDTYIAALRRIWRDYYNGKSI